LLRSRPFQQLSVHSFFQNRVLAWLAVAFLGFLAGYLAFGNANEVRRLSSLLSQAQADREALSQENAALLERRAALRVVEHTPEPSSASPTNSSAESITEADIKTALEMNKRSRNGEYILQFERPTDRKIMEAAVKEFAQSMASNNTPGLSNMFSTLGISPEKAQLLEKHAYKISVASLEAEQAISQVLRARTEYDSRVRSVLGDDAYAQYRQFEASKPALNEYALFQNFSSQNNVAIDPAYQQQVVGFMQQAQAYTELTFHGPYDGLTPVAVGNQMVTSSLNSQIDQLTQAANTVASQASEANLPESYVNLLKAYYAQSIQEKMNTITALNNRAPPPSGP